MKGLAERRKICSQIGEMYYPLETRREQTLRAAIRERLPAGGIFLDAGSGPYLGLARLFAKEARLSVGMDIQSIIPSVLATGARGAVGDLEAPPFTSEAVDVIAMRSVVEHLADPVRVFRALAHTLRPGGWIIAIAPSRWYYASIIGRLMPESLSHRLLGFIFGPTVYDNFPTYYRANTPAAMARVAREAGLELVEARVCPNPPDYLKFSPMLFRLGILYDRVTASTRWLEILQPSFLFLLRR